MTTKAQLQRDRERAARLIRTPRSMLLWLSKMNSRAIASKNIGSCESCLMSNFLLAKGFSYVHCGGVTVSISDTNNEIDLPDWFQRTFKILAEQGRSKGWTVSVGSVRKAINKAVKELV